MGCRPRRQRRRCAPCSSTGCSISWGAWDHERPEKLGVGCGSVAKACGENNAASHGVNWNGRVTPSAASKTVNLQNFVAGRDKKTRPVFSRHDPHDDDGHTSGRCATRFRFEGASSDQFSGAGERNQRPSPNLVAGVRLSFSQLGLGATATGAFQKCGRNEYWHQSTTSMTNA